VGRFKARQGGKNTRPGAAQAATDRPSPRPRPPRPPEIFLRKCAFEEAMQRLEQQVRAYAVKKQREILVVHGKGRGSPGGEGVLGPAVRAWCQAHPQLVDQWRAAPPAWGGDGATVLMLNI
jgi:DNA-nicking Smr family endonuclease